MIDLYTWATPNGQKASIMLEETGLEYTVHAVNIMENEQFDPAFLKVAPNNKIPAIIDRDTGMSLMESGAILLYLADKTGTLIAKCGAPRWKAIEWLMWQMGGQGPMLGQAHHFFHFNPDVSDYARNRYLAEARRLYRVLDAQIGDQDFVAGELSIADIAIWPWTARFEWQDIDLRDFPNVRRWYLAMATRPAVQRGYRVPVEREIPMPA